jgi:hypothetical protein
MDPILIAKISLALVILGYFVFILSYAKENISYPVIRGLIIIISVFAIIAFGIGMLSAIGFASGFGRGARGSAFVYLFAICAYFAFLGASCFPVISVKKAKSVGIWIHLIVPPLAILLVAMEESDLYQRLSYSFWLLKALCLAALWFRMIQLRERQEARVASNASEVK